MYKFKNTHPEGVTATYFKETKKLAYCRVCHPDGSMTFYYTYLEDLNHEEYPISEDAYKAVRGIPEWSLDWSDQVHGQEGYLESRVTPEFVESMEQLSITLNKL